MFRFLLAAALSLAANLVTAATLTANPANVYIPAGASTGSTTLSWNAPEAPTTVVFGISVNGAAEGFSSIYNRTGSTPVGYITKGNTYRFRLYAMPHTASSVALASITVVGTEVSGSLSASPPTVTIPVGASTGTTTLNWSSVGAANVVFGISVNGATEAYSSIYGPSGSTPVNYITANNTFEFRLYRMPHSVGDTPLAIRQVVGVAAQPQAACHFTYAPNSPPPTNLAVLGAGKTICLQPGTYSFTQTLDVGATQTIRGSTGNRADVTITSTAQRIFGFAGNGGTIADLSIVGQGVATEYAILSYVKDSPSIRNVSIRQVLIGIGINASTNVSISNCDIAQNGNPSQSPRVADPSLYVTDSTGVSVTGCRIEGTMAAGVVQDNDGGSAFYNSNNITFTNNQIFATGIVYFVNVNGGLVASNTADVGTEWGLDIVQNTRNVEFRDNHIQGMGWGAGVVAGTSNLTFRNNTYVDNNDFGIAYCSGLNIVHANCASTNSSLTIIGDRSYLNGQQQSAASCPAHGWPSTCPNG